MDRGRASYQTEDEGIGQRRPLEFRHEEPLGVSICSSLAVKPVQRKHP